jgi:hypothetical protein
MHGNWEAPQHRMLHVEPDHLSIVHQELRQDVPHRESCRLDQSVRLQGIFIFLRYYYMPPAPSRRDPPHNQAAADKPATT